MAKFCPNCGVAISAETLKFCPECGTPLTQSAENASVTPQQKPSTPKLNMMKKVYKCPDCGSYYDIDNAPNNCRGCGCFRGLFSLVDVDASFSIDEERKKEEKKIEKKKLAGFLIVIILLFSIPIFYGISTMDSTPSSTNEISSVVECTPYKTCQTTEPQQQIPSIDDYPDILEQALVCEEIWQKLQNEIMYVIPKKTKMQSYQGIYVQQILWDANDYMKEYEEQTENLIQLLNEHQFTDKAQIFKEDLKNKKAGYRDYQLKAMKTLGIIP